LINKAESHALWQENESLSDRASSDPELVVDCQGFEGPLDLLLHLARKQKVDLAQISLLALVEQYLTFVEAAQKLRLELAADYLVMAAWLAYLKSRLLVPKPKDEAEDKAEMLGEALAFRLQRLEAMRQAAERLFQRDQLSHDIFARGMPEMVITSHKSRFDISLYELLTAYAGLRQRNSASHVAVGGRTVWSLESARLMLERLLGEAATNDWLELDQFFNLYLLNQQERTTALASTFAASLEMVREGAIEIQQSSAFAPLYLRPIVSTCSDKDIIPSRSGAYS